MSDYIVQVQNLSIEPSNAGTITESGDYFLIYFNESSTFTYTGFNDLTNVDYLLVGGGGAGGLDGDPHWGSGGGGGGQYVARTPGFPIYKNREYKMVVGSGGVSTYGSIAGNGEESKLVVNNGPNKGMVLLSASGGGRGGDNGGTVNAGVELEISGNV